MSLEVLQNRQDQNPENKATYLTGKKKSVKSD